MKRRGRTEHVPLSYEQQRLYFLQEFDEHSWYYNVPVVLRLKGRVEEEGVEWSLREIVKRHEVLRTRIEMVGGEAEQKVEEGETWRMKVEEVKGGKEEIERRIVEEVRGKIDLDRGPLLRGLLLRLGEEERVLVLTLHHIAGDAWSMEVLARELRELYGNWMRGKKEELKELEVQYGDYAIWQREEIGEGGWEEEIVYWKERLEGAAVLELPWKGERPAVQGHEGGRASFEVSGEVLEKLKEVGRREGATLFMTLLAGFKVLLYRYTGETDVVVGTPVSGRRRKELEGLIGFFLNMQVLRTDLSGNPRYGELMKRVREVALGAYGHQELPFEKLVEEMEPERNMSRTPLFQAVFVLQHEMKEKWELPGVSVGMEEVDSGSAKFDLTLLMRQREGKLKGMLEYNREVLDGETVKRMGEHLKRMLEEVAKSGGEGRIGEIGLLGEAEREQILREWNGTEREYERGWSVVGVFEEQARRRGKKVAVKYGEREWTYEELNRRSNQVGRYLRRKGVGGEKRVGVMVERSLEMVAVLLGVVKAGGAYVPLDGKYPEQRLRYMVKDAGASVVVGEVGTGEKLEGYEGEVLELEKEWEEIVRESGKDLEVEISGENLAYVMYTSGSTGEPKGVGITHGNIVRLVRNTDYAEMSGEEVILQLAPVSFDASTFEIWGALLNGGKLAVYSGEEVTVAGIGEELKRERVSTLWLTAGLFHRMVEDGIEHLRGVKELVAGGDVLSAGAVRKVLEQLPECQLINGYGPTEGTTFSCCYRVKKEEAESWSKVPIGKPIANTRVYVLDEELELVGEGMVGEIYIGGEGVGRGYWGRGGMTGERFVPDGVSGREGERVYRSGDLGRWRRDGSLEYVGRKDGQVKVRGYRVELGEIERVVSGYEGVKECVVGVRGRQGGGGGEGEGEGEGVGGVCGGRGGGEEAAGVCEGEIAGVHGAWSGGESGGDAVDGQRESGSTEAGGDEGERGRGRAGRRGRRGESRGTDGGRGVGGGDLGRSAGCGTSGDGGKLL